MMKHNFINIYNTIKQAITQKKRYCIVKNTIKNKKFLNLLLLLGFITSVEYSTNKNIMVYLKFNKNRIAAIKDASILTKISKIACITTNKQKNDYFNFIVNAKAENDITSINKKYTRVLAKFR